MPALGGTAQERCHRRIGQHGLDARDQVRVGAVLRDLQHDALECRVQRVAEEARHPADQSEQTREEQVDIAAGQFSPAGRAGDAHITLDRELALPEPARQGPELLALLPVRAVQFADDTPGLVGIGVARAGQPEPVVGDQRVQVRRLRVQAQQVGDDAAAGMRHQADVRADRQRVGELHRILDRALRHRPVFEARRCRR